MWRFTTRQTIFDNSLYIVNFLYNYTAAVFTANPFTIGTDAFSIILKTQIHANDGLSVKMRSKPQYDTRGGFTMGNLYGYIRVSTKDQCEDRQLLAMRQFGVPEKTIYLDKLSGRDFDRPQYQQLLKKLRPGDVLAVKSIDRLGRNYSEIQEQWRFITKEKQTDVVVLDMPLLDTRQKAEDLTGAFITDLVLQILCYVAQLEREAIRQRQAEGIAAAKARGVRFGREKMPVPDAFYPLWTKFCKKEITARAAARELGVVHSTFLKWGQEQTAQKNL